MWRSISSRRCCFSTAYVARKLSSLQNSQSQVTHKPLNSSSSTLQQQKQKQKQPIKYAHQNHRFCFQSSSSVSEFENESHDRVISEELELENNNVGFDDKVSDFDNISENNDAQMDVCSSNDEKIEEEIVVEKSGEEINVEKLENVLSLLQSNVDVSLESSLNKLDLSLNEKFVVKVLETTPLVPGNHLIRFFNWVLSKNVVEVNTVLLSALSSAVCNDPELRMEDAYSLRDLVNDIGVKKSGVVNVEILNSLISAFLKLGKGYTGFDDEEHDDDDDMSKAAFEVFDEDEDDDYDDGMGKAAFEVFVKFEEFGCIPNVDTYYLTIKALSKRKLYDWAILVSQKMLDDGILPEREKVSEIISFYCKGFRFKEAYDIYLAAKKQNIYPRQRAVNFLISWLSKADGTVNIASEMLDDFPGEVRKHAVNPFSWVIHGLCRKNDIEGAKKLLADMIEKGPPPVNTIFDTIINSLSKAGEVEDAMEMLKLMESRGLKPDVYSYAAIVSGYVNYGMMEEACKVFSMAKKQHTELCHAIFHSMIQGYCDIEDNDKAVKLMSEMKDYGVEPRVHEYNKLIQSLCFKALDWRTAEKLLEEVKEKGLDLPGITQGLVSAVKELEQEAIASKEALAEPL